MQSCQTLKCLVKDVFPTKTTTQTREVYLEYCLISLHFVSKRIFPTWEYSLTHLGPKLTKSLHASLLKSVQVGAKEGVVCRHLAQVNAKLCSKVLWNVIYVKRSK